MSDRVMTPEFRVSFPAVFKPEPNMSGDLKYKVTMLFPLGADLSVLKNAAKEVTVEKYGADQAKWPKNLKLPFRDQGEKEYEGYEEGAIFMNCNNKRQPGLIDQKKQEIIDEEEFYPGCYARATVVPFVYEAKDPKTGAVLNRGVSFSLQNIQKTRDGEALGGGGRVAAEDEFEEIDSPSGSGSDSADPTGGDNDDLFA
jgi:hypothetical protein